MLIGAEVYWNSVENKFVREAGPTVVNSKLSYLLSETLPFTSTNVTTVSAAMLNVLKHHKKEDVDLELFWKLESMGVTETETTTTDVNFYDAYESGITYKDGHYIAGLPWKDDFFGAS